MPQYVSENALMRDYEGTCTQFNIGLANAAYGYPLDTCSGSARACVGKRGFALLVSTSSEPNDPPDLFFEKSLIP